MIDDLAAFIRARLDDAERAAQAAQPGPWALDYVAAGQHGIRDADGRQVAESLDPASARHILRHDPTGVLVDVAANRGLLEAILELTPGSWSRQGFHNGKPGTYVSRRLPDQRPALLQLMAMRWATHEDYREEWLQ